VTFADLAVFFICTTALTYKEEALAKVPALKQLYGTVAAHPRIKAYLGSDRYLGKK
jgi:glutathione S-transferase